MPARKLPPGVRKHATRSGYEYRFTYTSPLTGGKKRQSVYPSSRKELELITAAIYYLTSSGIYQVMAEQMGTPRQTAAMRIADAHKHGFLSPVDAPHSELWNFVIGKYEQWKKDNGTEQ
jgi:hypothetical protein